MQLHRPDHTSWMTFAVKILKNASYFTVFWFSETLYQWILSKSAAEVEFLCQNDQLAWAHDSKCNGNRLVFSSDYENTHWHTQDDTSPAGTLTTARRLPVLANQVHSFIMNLQLLSKRRHYSPILPARCGFSGRFLPPLGRAVRVWQLYTWTAAAGPVTRWSLESAAG